MIKMNAYKKYGHYWAGLLLAVVFISSGCNKYLDRSPLSNVTPQNFLLSEADLGTYTVAAYNFPTHDGWGPGTFGIDNNTDNQASTGYSTRWAPGEWRVPQSGGSWNFGSIRNINYFLETVLPRWKAGGISGIKANIDHYIGEAYFLRAYEYFNKIQAFGDFPIVKNTLPDEMLALTDASKRRPRNEVARFVISDLDSAISLLQTAPPNGKNRISKYAALLLKSRVGLHEGSWLTYHKGTAFVPGGPGWPGTGKVANFSINIDNEISYFLTQAMDAASKVADAVSLVNNTKDDGFNSSANPYFSMFSDLNLEKYPEVLLWRAYDATKGINHNVNHYINQNGANTGYTRGFVDNFLMANGLPIYAAGSGYQGDDSVQLVKIGRDNRLQLFMKAPGDLRYTDSKDLNGNNILEGNPDILGIPEVRYVTGYPVKKGLSYLTAQSVGSAGSTGSIVFRAVEAYLNYIEASYLKTGSIDGKADQYWKAIRNRAGVDPDYTKTIAATNMAEEAKNDFAAYSKGVLLTDKTLYNIRRERRSELMAEGLRYFDLKRWRALDQLKTSPYIIEGFKLWGPMQNWYKNTNGSSQLIEAGTPGKTANVSKQSESLYLRPYRINLTSSNLILNGYSWAYAHYLEPIAIQHFLITATTPSDPTTSVIYQNPYWPTEANLGATQ
jgi:hypothetical protein